MFFIRLVITSLFLICASLAAHAQVQYLQICDGGSSFFIPNTNNCADPNQIVTNQFNLATTQSAVIAGIAMSNAIVEPFLPDSRQNYAVSVHVAWFESQPAFGIAAMYRLYGNLLLTAGLAVAEDKGSVEANEFYQTAYGTQSPVQSWDQVLVLGRVGLTYSW
jgi:hypothetical protein